MTVENQIETYLAGQPEPKREEMRALHRLMLRMAPDARLWFLDGRNGEGKIVANPNIGYGVQRIDYAGGSSRDFYRIGLSANTAGLSVYIMGIADKTYLARTFGPTLGKAKVTGYCIKFRSLNDIDIDTLEDAVRFGLGAAAPSAAKA